MSRTLAIVETSAIDALREFVLCKIAGERRLNPELESELLDLTNAIKPTSRFGAGITETLLTTQLKDALEADSSAGSQFPGPETSRFLTETASVCVQASDGLLHAGYYVKGQHEGSSELLKVLPVLELGQSAHRLYMKTEEQPILPQTQTPQDSWPPLDPSLCPASVHDFFELLSQMMANFAQNIDTSKKEARRWLMSEISPSSEYSAIYRVLKHGRDFPETDGTPQQHPAYSRGEEAALEKVAKMISDIQALPLGMTLKSAYANEPIKTIQRAIFDMHRFRQGAEGRLALLEEQINRPEIQEFSSAVENEIKHQIVNRSDRHNDAGKEPGEWMWLIGHLVNKVLVALNAGDTEKALHHTISSAAVLGNWHARIKKGVSNFRPGIDPEQFPLRVVKVPSFKEYTPHIAEELRQAFIQAMQRTFGSEIILEPEL